MCPLKCLQTQKVAEALPFGKHLCYNL